MLKTTKLANKASVDCLTKLWAERYVPDLSILSSTTDCFTVSDLLAASSPQGRAQTLAKLQRMVEINCKCAGIQTNAIFSYIPNVVSLTEAQGIARAAALAYQQVLEVYQRQVNVSPLQASIPENDTINLSTDIFKASELAGLSLSEVQQLADAIEPVLLLFQDQHLSAIDRRAVGFMSTQFHLSAKLVLNRLSAPEQLLLSPYFKFVEEQVCIPWQRVCAAASQHELESPALVLVQQMLPASGAIAQRVYRRAVELYPHHRSRRGTLREPVVKASSIRDIEMFQGYLWLCVLEGNMSAVEEELLPLCLMVFPSIEVTWDLVEQLMPLLITEIQTCISSAQKQFLRPYTRAMQQLFSNLEAKAIEQSKTVSCALKAR
jgi:hypothetical protein